jgi:RNA polymerase sigma factor (sigma-70 family)
MDADTARRQLSAALVRVAHGDRDAVRLVYQETSAKLFGICLRILRDRGHAEDALQDVYLTVWRRAATFDPGKASPITWLVTVARNISIDRLRSGGSARWLAPIEEADDVQDSMPNAAAAFETAEQNQRLKDCLDQLDERASSAIRAAFLDGLTYDELAERSGVPLGTMKSIIRRGLMKLKGCLEA